MISEYEDMIALPHHRSTRHRQMALQDRAAQFAPFAALTGYEESIAEKGRLTDLRKILSEYEQDILDRKLQYLLDSQSMHPLLTIAYHIPDNTKDGGFYTQAIGTLKQVDLTRRELVLEDDSRIPLEQIIDLLIQIKQP